MQTKRNAFWRGISAAVALVALPSAAVTEWPLERLTIAAGYFDGPGVKTEENVRRLKEAGFDLVIHGRNGDTKTLDLFEKYGLKTVLNGVADRVSHGKIRQRDLCPPAYYDAGSARFVDHPAIVGIDMGDEPSALDADYFGEVAARVGELYPGKFPYMNLFPNYATYMTLARSEAESQLGTKSYADYLAAFSKTLPLNYICFDFYIYSAARNARARQMVKFWENFDDVAKVTRETGRQFCVWLLSGSHERYADEPTTENELRFQAYSAMAYGASLICWGCYAGGWWTNQAVRADGTLSCQYARLKKVNGEIRALAATYDRLRCVNTHHVTTNALDTGFFKGLRSEAGSELAVGEMVGKTTHDPWRGLFILAADDPFDTNSVERVVTFTSAYPVDVRTPEGCTALTPGADGAIRLKLRSNQAALVVTRLTAADVAPASRRRRDGFLRIGCSAIFPSTKFRPGCEQDVADCQELGIEVGSGRISPDPKVFAQHAPLYLDWCRKHNVAWDVSVEGRWSGGRKAGTMHELWPMSRFDAQIAEFKTKYDYSSPDTIDFCDEPNVLDMPYAGQVAARFINSGAKMMPFVNIYPNYASVSWNSDSKQKSQLGTRTYAEYVDAYCREVPLDYICFDHYPLGDNAKTTLGPATTRWYDNWEDVARAARRTGREVWFIGQVNTKPRNVKWITENQMRFQIGTALAYGATYYHFATIHQTWWTNCVVELNGRRTEHFEKVRRLVAEMKSIRGEYALYRNVATTLVGFPERGNILGFSNGFFRDVRAADASRIVVGDMVARDTFLRKRALYVLAADDMMDVKRRVREIRFRTVGENVSVKGPNGPIPLRRLPNGEYAFSLRDCAGALVQIDN